jgi:hypothetical protein
MTLHNVSTTLLFIFATLVAVDAGSSSADLLEGLSAMSSPADYLQMQVYNNPPVVFKVTRYFPFILAAALFPLLAIPVGAILFWILAASVA